MNQVGACKKCNAPVYMEEPGLYSTDNYVEPIPSCNCHEEGDIPAKEVHLMSEDEIAKLQEKLAEAEREREEARTEVKRLTDCLGQAYDYAAQLREMNHCDLAVPLQVIVEEALKEPIS